MGAISTRDDGTISLSNAVSPIFPAVCVINRLVGGWSEPPPLDVEDDIFNQIHFKTPAKTNHKINLTKYTLFSSIDYSITKTIQYKLIEVCTNRVDATGIKLDKATNRKTKNRIPTQFKHSMTK